ncbi:MAG TPA: PKD domain-containing protein, partial [Candidatus Limnocylindrales bacterium]|nr:PKD domain-containing protein [Candidatus Limnocylindrales bacterium]
LAPQSLTSPSTTDPASLGYLNSYYKTALSYPTLYSLGSIYKGFNDSLASWGSNRYINQQCGQTWLESIADAGNFYSATNQMIGVQVVTWNDYEEGTEIESGIDNCVSVETSVSGTVVNWAITGKQNTIDHFSVFASQDGQNLMWLADTAAAARSLDLARFSLDAGNYTVFVKATGKPSLTNKMSAGAQMTISNQPPLASLALTTTSAYAPASITASTAGSNDPDGTIASSTIDFGDGTSAAGPTASHSYSTPGTYTVTATVTDNLGAASSTTANVSVQAPQVIISAPAIVAGAAASSLTSPVHVAATGYSGYTVTAMQIYLDGTLVYTVKSQNLDTNVTVAPGTHKMAVKGWDSSGRNFLTSVSISVANQPPIAALSMSAGSILAGGAVTASTSGASDPDGSIASSSINFGDGSAAVAGATATHQYKIAGTYAVTATVTDNLGASSTATQTVTVNPQYVTITSPTFTSTTNSSVHVIGTAFSGYPVTATQVFVDGVFKYQTSGSTADTFVKLSVGTHRIAVQGKDDSGALFKAWVYVTRN